MDVGVDDGGESGHASDPDTMEGSEEMIVCGSVRVRRREVVGLVAQFLDELNLPAAVAALRAEAGVAFDTRRAVMDALADRIVHGQWQHAVAQMVAMPLSEGQGLRRTPVTSART